MQAMSIIAARQTGSVSSLLFRGRQSTGSYIRELVSGGRTRKSSVARARSKSQEEQDAKTKRSPYLIAQSAFKKVRIVKRGRKVGRRTWYNKYTQAELGRAMNLNFEVDVDGGYSVSTQSEDAEC